MRRACHLLVELNLIRVESLFTIDSRVFLDDSNNFGSFFVHELGIVVTNISEALNNNSFPFNTGGHVSSLTKFIVVQ
jgi:hypothetical protein